MYRVELASAPRRFYAKANRPLAMKLARCLEQLESDPRHHNNVKALRGPFAGRYRFRVGDWRVIFRVDEKARVVYVLDIAHRSEVYE